jgi:hypothetical protein
MHSECPCTAKPYECFLVHSPVSLSVVFSSNGRLWASENKTRKKCGRNGVLQYNVLWRAQRRERDDTRDHLSQKQCREGKRIVK